jgi:hypothetical protein
VGVVSIISDNNTKRGQIRGYIFEVVTRLFLKKNGWAVINKEEHGRLRITNNYGIEIKGRGTWHQIDTPCIYSTFIPFVYSLRLLVEVKFYSSEIQKEKIRSYIGVIKDISENYIIHNTEDINSQLRYTDIGAFFSASGFQEEAINLAYAHGIKTISYKNNYAIKEIIEQINTLEEGLAYSDTVARNKQTIFMRDLEYVLLNYTEGSPNFYIKYVRHTSVHNSLLQLAELIENTQSSFFGMNSQGVMLHFLSQDLFPEEIFSQTDEQECEIYYSSTGRQVNAWITFTNDINKGKFYFDVPPSLLDIILSGENALNVKEIIFENLTVFYYIRDIFRTLTLRINKQWLQELRDSQRIQ